MKKRFIICIDKSTKEQDLFFIEYLKTNKVAWWHWLSNTWLVSNTSGQLTASGLRDKLKEIFTGEHTLVFEITATNDTWAGFGPQSDSKNMFAWLKTNWQKS